MATALIEVNAGRAIHAVARLAAAADDLEPFFGELGPALVGSTQRRMDAGVDPDGLPWAKLALSTAKRKAKAGRTKMLQWDGFLRNSLTHRATRTSLEWGTPMAYGPAHQFGAHIERFAQSPLVNGAGTYRRWRDVTVEREDGTSYTAKRFAGNAHKRIAMMARTVIGAADYQLPARPFIGFSAEDEATTLRKADLYLAGAVHAG